MKDLGSSLVYDIVMLIIKFVLRGDKIS